MSSYGVQAPYQTPTRHPGRAQLMETEGLYLLRLSEAAHSVPSTASRKWDIPSQP